MDDFYDGYEGNHNEGDWSKYIKETTCTINFIFNGRAESLCMTTEVQHEDVLGDPARRSTRLPKQRHIPPHHRRPPPRRPPPHRTDEGKEIAPHEEPQNPNIRRSPENIGENPPYDCKMVDVMYRDEDGRRVHGRLYTDVDQADIVPTVCS